MNIGELRHQRMRDVIVSELERQRDSVGLTVDTKLLHGGVIHVSGHVDMSALVVAILASLDRTT